VDKGGHWWTKVGIGGRKDFFGVYLFGCSFGSRLTKYVWFCQSVLHRCVQQCNTVPYFVLKIEKRIFYGCHETPCFARNPRGGWGGCAKTSALHPVTK